MSRSHASAMASVAALVIVVVCSVWVPEDPEFSAPTWRSQWPWDAVPTADTISLHFDRTAAANDDLILSDTGLQSVRDSHRTRLGFDPLAAPSAASATSAAATLSSFDISDRFFRAGSPCPQRRFLFANTNTFGRHHNQLQELMNLVLVAERLNRTAVLGWFDFVDKWVEPAAIYDFRLIRRAHCVLEGDAFRQHVWPRIIVGDDGNGREGNQAAGAARHRRGVAVEVYSMGQGLDKTPLAAAVRDVRPFPFVPETYMVRGGTNITRASYLPLLQAHPRLVQAHLIVLSAQVAYYLRPRLTDLITLFGLLRPSPAIRAEVVAALGRMHLHAAEPVRRAFGLVDPATDPTGSSAATTSSPYFSLHLRQREGLCMKERAEIFADSATLRTALTPAQRDITQIQCGLSVAYVDSIFRRHNVHTQDGGSSSNKQGPPAALTAAITKLQQQHGLFLASDHQNLVLERALVKRGAQLYTGGAFSTGTEDRTGLHGLAVDYWLLVAGDYFTGNQVSSISQNVCSARLGLGLGCQGFIEIYTLYLTAPV